MWNGQGSAIGAGLCNTLSTLRERRSQWSLWQFKHTLAFLLEIHIRESVLLSSCSPVSAYRFTSPRIPKAFLSFLSCSELYSTTRLQIPVECISMPRPCTSHCAKTYLLLVFQVEGRSLQKSRFRVPLKEQLLAFGTERPANNVTHQSTRSIDGPSEANADHAVLPLSTLQTLNSLSVSRSHQYPLQFSAAS